MIIKLLKPDFEKDNILIQPWNSFTHIKEFLVSDASQYIKSKLCSIFAYEKHDKIVGFISLSASSIKLKKNFFDKIQISDLEDVKISIPCILIWRLLVCEKQRWQKIGEKLLLAMMSHCYDISKTIWVRFIVVDSHIDAVGFYEKYWFIEISEGNKTKKMVFDLKMYEE